MRQSGSVFWDFVAFLHSQWVPNVHSEAQNMFLRHNTDTLTISSSVKHKQSRSIQVARVIEAVLRSLDNLILPLNLSSMLYIPFSTGLFVPLGLPPPHPLILTLHRRKSTNRCTVCGVDAVPCCGRVLSTRLQFERRDVLAHQRTGLHAHLHHPTCRLAVSGGCCTGCYRHTNGADQPSRGVCCDNGVHVAAG